MNTGLIANERLLCEAMVMRNYLEGPNDDSFAELFKTFTPQLVAFFRTHRCELSLAEDLAQEVMLTTHLKAAQIRDRKLFRAWLFKVAHNALCRYYRKQTRDVETVNLEDINDHLIPDAHKSAGTPAFEFQHWIAFLDSRDREVMRLRFIEEWEYHEIAAAHALPIGTVQWKIFNAKKKLALHLAVYQEIARKVA
jgi:RNA polymerase sigma-70 factor (ECF subfamily)